MLVIDSCDTTHW